MRGHKQYLDIGYRLISVRVIDPRKLSMLPHLIARQHPGRREHIHGRVHSLECRCDACRKVAA
jgi:hypothetical protein